MGGEIPTYDVYLIVEVADEGGSFVGAAVFREADGVDVGSGVYLRG